MSLNIINNPQDLSSINLGDYSYSLPDFSCNESNEESEASGDADGNAKIRSLGKPTDDWRSYQETKEADARNYRDGNARLHRCYGSRQWGYIFLRRAR